LEILASPSSSYVQPVSTEAQLDLGVGEARFDLPEAVRTECARRVAQLPQIGYSDPQGEAELRDSYLRHMRGQAEGVSPLQASDVLVTAGGKEAAWLAIAYGLQKSGAQCAIVPQPGWEPYAIWLRAADCVLIGYEPGALAADPKLLRRLVDHAPVRPALLVVNYPNNPTGVSVSQDQMDALVAEAARLQLTVVSDEVYRAFGAPDVTAARAPAFEPGRDLVVDSCSKWLGMAGLRVGFLLAGTQPIRDLVRFRATYASCTSVVTQRLATALLNSAATAEWLAEMQTQIAKNRDALAAELTARGITVESHGNLYLWCRQPDPATLAEPCAPQTARITYGSGFGAPGHIRLCVARPALDPAQAAEAVLATLRGR
jgi:aspartate/methionine/tyrosine aminotransferase